MAKKARDDLKNKIEKSMEKVLLCNSKEAMQDIYDMYHILQKLQNLILEFGKEFSNRKREKNIVDFNDLEHFALEILLNSEEVRKKYQEKFVEIAIDEYQDSNLVQETILTSISRNNNIFMVGDVKQSIYKFRQAMPDLFLDKYETYRKKEDRKEKDGLKIQLYANFRSKENVLKFTNILFENIMSKSLGEIEYNEEEYLNPGAKYPKIDQNEKIEINIIDPKAPKEGEEQEDCKFSENGRTESLAENNKQDQDENITDVELEAKFVTNKIKELIESKFQVWDKKKEKYRDIQYKDIAVLLRTTTNVAPIYEQEILNQQIPVFSDSSQDYLDSIEIQTIMSLLKIIDNPMQDIPLVAVMRSNIGKFTDDELIQIRLADKYDDFYTCMEKAKLSVGEDLKNKIESFIESLNKWRKEQEYLALDELIWKIYMDSNYYHYVGLMPNGILRQANLRMLFERAKQYETASFKGLYNFIQFIDKLKIGSKDMDSAKIIGENDNVVRILSIHKSKGLEFPVIFLASTGKQFNLTDLNKSLLLHQDLGIGVKYINYEKQVQYDTLTKSAIRNKVLTESLSEEMRVLYVALTRAKQKLFISGILKEYEKNTDKMLKQVENYKKLDGKINPILVKKHIKFIDWILLTYFYEKEELDKITEINIYKPKDITGKSIEDENEIDVIKLLEEHKKDKKEIQKVEEELNKKYKYELSTIIPTKTSVTKIKQKDQEQVKITFETPKFAKNEEDIKLTGAQKGTLIHLCLQKLDEKQDYDFAKIKELVLNLVKKEIITEKEADNINIDAILKFTKSKIWQELKNAKEVHKEEPFYINIPAKEVYEQDVPEQILVQGIIDLYYINENDELVLVDYKTDFVQNENELKQKYETQLLLYKKALENALNKKVDRIYIYSTFLGKELY